MRSTFDAELEDNQKIVGIRSMALIYALQKRMFRKWFNFKVCNDLKMYEILGIDILNRKNYRSLWRHQIETIKCPSSIISHEISLDKNIRRSIGYKIHVNKYLSSVCFSIRTIYASHC